ERCEKGQGQHQEARASDEPGSLAEVQAERARQADRLRPHRGYRAGRTGRQYRGQVTGATPPDQALSRIQSPAPDDLWRAMRALVERLFALSGRDTVLDDSIDILMDLLGADRGLV